VPWLVKLPWKAGQLDPADAEGQVWVSATRLEWKRALDLPGISAKALGLRRLWSERPGTLGISVAFEPRRSATWSLSVWQDREAFQRFLTSPEHKALMTDYLPALACSDSAFWPVDRFALGAAWQEARRRLAKPVVGLREVGGG
jgi:hypothetical protein